MKTHGIPCILAALLLIGLFSSPATADPFPPGPENDYETSLGIFRIWVDTAFRPLIEGLGLPPCDSTVGEHACYSGEVPFRLQSSVLIDEATIIGRSAMHTDGSGPDGGTTVGVDAWAITVGDGDFQLKPAFEGPPGGEEVHTAVAQLTMIDYQFLSGTMVKAGHYYGLPLSPGEVESQSGTGLPGESFFNVFVEITLPLLEGDAILVNTYPLLIVNEDVDSLPPTVVYTHENSEAVPVYFANTNLPHWSAGQLLGYMTLAGHGYSYSGFEKQPGIAQFLQVMNVHLATKGPMPLPGGGVIPTLTGWGLIVFCFLLFGWMAWVLVRRRKAVS